MIGLHDKIGNVDAIIIPGTRNSTQDTCALYESGLAEKIIKKSKEIPIIGICGGFQILGEKILDENKKESKKGNVNGLGLLPITSEFKRTDKIVTQTQATIPHNLNGIANEMFENIKGQTVTGYEIHEGTTEINNHQPLLKIKKGQGNNEKGEFDGITYKNIFATYLHGIFHNYNIRREFLNYLRRKKGLTPHTGKDPYETKKNYSLDKLAEIVEQNLNMDIIDDLIFKN